MADFITVKFIRGEDSIVLSVTTPTSMTTQFCVWKASSTEPAPQILKMSPSEKRAVNWLNRRCRAMTRAGWSEVIR